MTDSWVYVALGGITLTALNIIIVYYKRKIEKLEAKLFRKEFDLTVTEKELKWLRKKSERSYA